MACDFYLMRHGETDWNLEGRILGQGDPPLNAKGRSQGQGLAERVAGIDFDALYTSDLTRARMTAELVAAGRPGLSIECDPRLREGNAGDATGMFRAEVHSRWILDEPHGLPAGAESRDQLGTRVVAFMAEAAARHSAQTVGVVTHGGVLRAVMAHLLGLPFSQKLPFAFDNCSVTLVEWGARPKVQVVNHCGPLVRY